MRAVARIEIRGEQHTIGEIFSERYSFAVPAYQRTYAWTTEHAGQMLDDLLESLGDEGPIEEVSPYFLGSVVLIQGEQPDAQIVDGQQRLITLTILLAALRALVPAEIAEGITRSLYAPADPLKNLPARYRVHPKARDVSFFQSYIQDVGGIERLRGQMFPELSDSQRNMRENALLYLRRLGELAEARRVRLARFVTQRCLLVTISTPDLGAAYRIFSVLNDRGLDLSAADILKAEVIGRLPEYAQAEHTERWEEAEESLGREGFEQLIRHVTLIQRKSALRGSILDEFRVHVLQRLGDPARVVDDVLVPYGAAFYAIRNANYEYPDGAEQVNILLHWLNQIDNGEWVPSALLYLRRYHDQPERLARFFPTLERLAASLMIRRQYANKRQSRYNKLLAAIDGDADLSRSDSPIQLTTQECEETMAMLNGDLYLMPPTPRRYILLRLDANLAGTPLPTYQPDVLTVEHVLPRTPKAGSEWTRTFPTAKLRAGYVHRLGNLALLSRAKNAHASNYDFAQKKTIYFSPRNGVAPFALTAQILREAEWTPAVVERRQSELLGRLKALWRL